MKGFARLATVSAAVACAVYTLLYLYRWEWHRAIVAGIFLVVAEVAIATAAVLRRLNALDRSLTDVAAAGRAPVADLSPLVAGPGRPRVTEPSPFPAGPGRPPVTEPSPFLGGPGRPRVTEPSPALVERVREAAPDPRPPFAWLAPDRFGVFLPILLGAGVLASALAWAVESVARSTARPALERRLAFRLAVFAPPAGGLLPSPAAPGPATAAGRPPARWSARSAVGVVAVGFLAVTGLAAGIDELSDATQSRADVPRAGVQTVIELELHGELAGAVPTRVATSLWHTCVGSLRQTIPEPAVTALGGSRMQLLVPADVGQYTARKLHGCLEDAALDRVQAAVVTFRTDPRSP